MYVIDLIVNDGYFGAMKVQFAKPFNSWLHITAVETLDIQVLVCLFIFILIKGRSVGSSL